MNISKIIVSVFALYLLIFCNFTKELIGCKFNYLLDTNIYTNIYATDIKLEINDPNTQLYISYIYDDVVKYVFI